MGNAIICLFLGPFSPDSVAYHGILQASSLSRYERTENGMTQQIYFGNV